MASRITVGEWEAFQKQEKENKETVSPTETEDEFVERVKRAAIKTTNNGLDERSKQATKVSNKDVDNGSNALVQANNKDNHNGLKQAAKTNRKDCCDEGCKIATKASIDNIDDDETKDAAKVSIDANNDGAEPVTIRKLNMEGTSHAVKLEMGLTQAALTYAHLRMEFAQVGRRMPRGQLHEITEFAEMQNDLPPGTLSQQTYIARANRKGWSKAIKTSKLIPMLRKSGSFPLITASYA
jgi:hypothetical protein